MQQADSVIGLGGSFDHFHAGHQHFLEFAARYASKLLVGITVPALTQSKEFGKSIQPWTERRLAVATFLDQKNIEYELFPLEDVYGPTLSDSRITAVAVTELTQKGGRIINAGRKAHHLPPLPVYVCDMVLDKSGQVLSSTRIRAGKVNRVGDVYEQLFKKDIILSAKQRLFWQHPQGKIVVRPSLATRISYVVGDVVLETFLKNDWPFEMGVFDRRSGRKDFSSAAIAALKPDQIIKNKAGEISLQLIESLKSSRRFIEIGGEEDLAAVALVLLAPLDSAVYYGQPNQGMVEMIVTEELKEKFAHRLKSV